MAEGGMSKKGLNVNAQAFVPNVNAPAFVPGKKIHQADTSPAVEQQKPAAEEVVNGVNAVTEQLSSMAGPSESSETPPPVPKTDATSDEWDQGAEEEQNGESETAAAQQQSSKRKKQSPTPESSERKEYVNVVFIGHVDAGKSTIAGHIMYLTGMVDKRTMDKYRQEAKEKNRETWYLSWALDTNQEERDKGKTVEVGRAYFETEKKHFTVLDAPGHKSFVPNMISGASQADLAVLVISARKGEFEAGFERGGQTLEHAVLVKTAGVKHLVILVNKMDDPTVEWDRSRFEEIKEKIGPDLKKKCGFNPKTDIYYIPCSGLTGAFLSQRSDAPECSWYTGPCFIEYIDSMPPIRTMGLADHPLRVVLVDKYNDMGTVVLGKVESGTIAKGQTLLLMPNRTQVQVLQLWSDDQDTDEATPGENIKLKLKGVEEDDILSGFVLSALDNPVKVGRVFDAQVQILEHKSIICPGYSAVLHIHSAVEEVTVKMLGLINAKQPNEKPKSTRYVKQDQVCRMRLESTEVFCLEAYKDFPQMGRFTLRDEGKTIAIGKVLVVIE